MITRLSVPQLRRAAFGSRRHLAAARTSTLPSASSLTPVLFTLASTRTAAISLRTVPVPTTRAAMGEGSRCLSMARGVCGTGVRRQRFISPFRREMSSTTTSTSTSTSTPSTASNQSHTPSPLPPSSPPIPLPRSLTPRSVLLILRVPVPPKHWPSHLDLASPLLLHLSTALKRLSPSSPSALAYPVAVNAVWDGIGSAEFFGPAPGEADEAYPAEIHWPDGGCVRYDRLDAGMIKSGEVQRDLVEKKVDWEVALRPEGREGRDGREEGEGEETKHEILICTHGSRDCRCGDAGGELVRALNAEIGKRSLEGRVVVSEIAHVGGHKYAPNALLLPSLDMLSALSPPATSAPLLVDFILRNKDRAHPAWAHWRGRMGLGEDAQRGVWNGVGAAHVEERLVERGEAASAAMGMGIGSEAGSDGGGGESASQGRDETAPALADESSREGLGAPIKIKLRFQTYEGDVKEVHAHEGETLLQVARRENLPAMEGTCGGNLECATCHLYLPASCPAPPESEAELDMLGYALGYVEGQSRLGCRVRVTTELGRWVEGGGVMRLPRF